ncbi:MAG: hypothetical protein QM752_05450 [Gammaproteobacteria bacterium]
MYKKFRIDATEYRLKNKKIKIPNAKTFKAMQEAEQGKTCKAKNVDELFKTFRL